MTLGVNYTPVPLVTIGAEHREGKGNNNNTSVNVQLNYRMGQPWNDQIDQSAVAANRTLAGSVMTWLNVIIILFWIIKSRN